MHKTTVENGKPTVRDVRRAASSCERSIVKAVETFAVVVLRYFGLTKAEEGEAQALPDVVAFGVLASECRADILGAAKVTDLNAENRREYERASKAFLRLRGEWYAPAKSEAAKVNVPEALVLAVRGLLVSYEAKEIRAALGVIATADKAAKQAG